MPSIEVGPTALARLTTLTLTFNPLRTIVRPTHVQTFKVNSQSVPKTEWKQTDGQTDKLAGGGDCITCRINAVGIASL